MLDFLYDFCRISQIALCKHEKSFKNVSYHSVVYDKKHFEHVQLSYDIV